MTIKFFELSGLPEVFNDLALLYSNSIPFDPVLGVLQINAHFQNIPPINRINISPVGAHISDISFKVWGNPLGYLSKHESVSMEAVGKRLPKSFYEKTLQLCQNQQLLLALTTLLFLDGQMRTFSKSPSPAQDVLLQLLSPIITYKPIELDKIKASGYQANAHIRVVLCAGKTPFVQTYHDERTIRSWQNELEAATVLLLPQVALFTEATLSETTKRFFLDKLKDEIETWRRRKPKLGEAPSWSWLPKLL